MPKEPQHLEEKRSKVPKVRHDPAVKEYDPGRQPPLVALQNQVGNAAVQRLIAQASTRGNDGPTELDEETATRIQRARGGGRPLDDGLQTKMGDAMGQDFGDVRVHTSHEADALNQDLDARAFTTGHDLFFREGAYAPNTSSGQELIAHELTHVVQQRTGAVQSSGRMAVNAPGDRFEREADTVAKQVANGGGAPEVQRQTEEEDEVLTKRAPQRQAEEEDEVLTKRAVQRQEEEDEVLTKRALQRQEEEEEVLTKRELQRQEEEEEPPEMTEKVAPEEELEEGP